MALPRAPFSQSPRHPTGTSGWGQRSACIASMASETSSGSHRQISNSPPAPSRALVAARDGTLWVGTRNGLSSWKNGKLTQYAELAGLHVFALVEDDEGSIWAGTNGSPGPPDGKLCEIRNGGVQCHPEMDGVGRGVFGLHKDGKGNLWVGLETGVWRWRPGPPEFYAVPGLPNGRMQGMADGEDGALLIAATGAVMRLADGKAEAVYRFPTARRGFRFLKNAPRSRRRSVGGTCGPGHCAHTPGTDRCVFRIGRPVRRRHLRFV